MQYNWQQNDWPNFRYSLSGIQDYLLTYLEKVAHLSGILKALPNAQKIEATVDLMTEEALKTSEIEGEFLDRSDVKSSILNNLGLAEKPYPVHDLRAIGLGQMMTAIRKTYAEELTQEHLFSWHKMLLSYRKDLNHLGGWRQHADPMQIVSGAMGKEKVHFIAPPSSIVPKEMGRFIKWFNSTMPEGKKAIKSAPVRAAVAHLYFESIHPFEDGNGRIGRAIAEKALSQNFAGPVPFSLSNATEADKKAYYQKLEHAQRSNEITGWMEYFIPMVLTAIENAEERIGFTLKKAWYFDRYREVLNERQSKVIRRMFEAGPSGFDGGMNARKYVGIAKVSKATATRDLQYLSKINALIPIGGGRSTRYELNLDYVQKWAVRHK